MFSEEKKKKRERRLPEYRNQAPDTEQALWADTEMKHLKTLDIMRKNEGRADAFAFYYLEFCKGSQHHTKSKNMCRIP